MVTSVETVKSLPPDTFFIFDTRSPELFCSGHIPGSISIPSGEDFEEWCFLMGEGKKSIYALCDDSDISANTAIMKRVLKKRFSGVIEGGINAWIKNENTIDVIVDILSDEFHIDYKFEDRMAILDLRESGDYLNHHILEAVSYPLSDIRELFPSVDPEDNIYLYSDKIEHTTLAASVFKRLGLFSIRCVLEPYDILKKMDFDFEGREVKKKSK